jgi:hypothetical protein
VSGVVTSLPSNRLDRADVKLATDGLEGSNDEGDGRDASQSCGRLENAIDTGRSASAGGGAERYDVEAEAVVLPGVRLVVDDGCCEEGAERTSPSRVDARLRGMGGDGQLLLCDVTVNAGLAVGSSRRGIWGVAAPAIPDAVTMTGSKLGSSSLRPPLKSFRSALLLRPRRLRGTLLPKLPPPPEPLNGVWSEEDAGGVLSSQGGTELADGVGEGVSEDLLAARSRAWSSEMSLSPDPFGSEFTANSGMFPGTGIVAAGEEGEDEEDGEETGAAADTCSDVDSAASIERDGESVEDAGETREDALSLGTGGGGICAAEEEDAPNRAARSFPPNESFRRLITVLERGRAAVVVPFACCMLAGCGSSSEGLGDEALRKALNGPPFAAAGLGGRDLLTVSCCCPPTPGPPCPPPSSPSSSHGAGEMCVTFGARSDCMRRLRGLGGERSTSEDSEPDLLDRRDSASWYASSSGAGAMALCFQGVVETGQAGSCTEALSSCFCPDRHLPGTQRNPCTSLRSAPDHRSFHTHCSAACGKRIGGRTPTDRDAHPKPKQQDGHKLGERRIRCP